MAVLGCQKDEFENEATNGKFSVLEAKSWYEVHKPQYIELKSGGNETKVKQLKPDWSKSNKSANDKVEVVEVDLTSEEAFGFAAEESWTRWKETNDKQWIASKSRLVVLKQKKDGNIISFMMTSVGNKDYLENKNFDVSSNRYLKRDKDFNGYIFYNETDGRYANGWYYENGKVKHKIVPEDQDALQLRLKSAPVEYCYITTITELWWEYYPSCNCSALWYNIYNIIHYCWWEDPNGGGGGGGGGGTPGGYTPNNPVDPNLPCSNDPIKNPTIASSGPSGQHGGLFGCVRQGDNDCSEGVYNKFHGGIDISADYGTDIYSMYSGTATKHYEPGGLGNYIIVSSSINGQSLNTYYGHLSAINISDNQWVNSGTIIGRSGNSGNAGSSTPHVHIQTFINGTRVSPLQYFYTQFDPNTGSVLNDPCNSL